MKLVRIIILIAFVVSFMPLEAFCDDHHETAEQHHGVIHCQVSCCQGAILTNSSTTDLQNLNSYLTLSYGLIYEAPVLPTEFRPPITVS